MKKFLSITIIAIVVFVATFNLNIALKSEKGESNLTLAEIEALADNEKKRIKYVYDESGNMIRREIVVASPVMAPPPANGTDSTSLALAESVEIGKDETEEVVASRLKSSSGTGGVETNASENQILNDWDAEKKISIYPNPTQGAFRVDIIGEEIPEDAKIFIYDMTGRLVHRQKGISSVNLFDISAQPAGTYLVRIELGGDNVSTWKIVKS